MFLINPITDFTSIQMFKARKAADDAKARESAKVARKKKNDREKAKREQKRKRAKARRMLRQRFLAVWKRVRNKVTTVLGRKNRNKKRLTVWMKIVRRVIWEAKYPVAAALIWVAIKYPDAKVLSDSVGHAVSALTVVLILQTFLLRIAKSIRDEEHMKRTASSFRDLKAQVESTHTLSWSIFSTVKGLAANQPQSVSSRPRQDTSSPSISPARVVSTQMPPAHASPPQRQTREPSDLLS
jgi:hypothetical protein